MAKDSALYWRKNIRLLIILLSIWFVVSFLLGIVFSDALDEIEALSFAGFKMGFWISQQGAIIVYILLIFFYVKGMEKLDKEFDVSDEPQDVGEH